MSGPLNLAQVVSFLMDAPMFRDLDEAELSVLVHRMQIVHLRPGQVLFRAGDLGDAWYVVYRGQLRVDADGRILARVGPPSCVGEMAVLDGSPRSATVSASEDSTVFRFSRDAFEELREAEAPAAHKLVYQMALTLASRQRATTQKLVAWWSGAEAGRSSGDEGSLVGPLVRDAAASE